VAVFSEHSVFVAAGRLSRHACALIWLGCGHIPFGNSAIYNSPVTVTLCWS